MWMVLLTTVCMMVLVVLGMLIMTQIVTLEALTHGFWRGLLLIALGLISICVFKAALLPILICLLLWLKHVMAAVFGIVLTIIALTLTVQITIRLIRNRSIPERGNKEEQ